MIPKFFGKGSFDVRLTLFPLKVEGNTLYDLARGESSVEEETLKSQLGKGLRDLYVYGAEY